MRGLLCWVVFFTILSLSVVVHLPKLDSIKYPTNFETKNQQIISKYLNYTEVEPMLGNYMLSLISKIYDNSSTGTQSDYIEISNILYRYRFVCACISIITPAILAYSLSNLGVEPLLQFLFGCLYCFSLSLTMNCRQFIPKCLQFLSVSITLLFYSVRKTKYHFHIQLLEVFFATLTAFIDIRLLSLLIFVLISQNINYSNWENNFASLFFSIYLFVMYISLHFSQYHGERDVYSFSQKVFSYFVFHLSKDQFFQIPNINSETYLIVNPTTLIIAVVGPILSIIFKEYDFTIAIVISFLQTLLTNNFWMNSDLFIMLGLFAFCTSLNHTSQFAQRVTAVVVFIGAFSSFIAYNVYIHM